MMTDKTIKVSMIVLSLMFTGLVVKKVFFKKQVSRNQASFAMGVGLDKTGRNSNSRFVAQNMNLKNMSPTEIVNARKFASQARISKIKESLGDSEIGKVAFKTLSQNGAFCTKQENCPVEISQLFSYMVSSLPTEGNEINFLALQRRVKRLEVSSEVRQNIFADLLIKVGDHNDESSSFKPGSMRINKKSLLVVATLRGYLEQKPDAKSALDIVRKSLSRSQDPLITKIAQSMMLRAYPQYNQQIRGYFANSGLAGSRG